MSEPKQKKLTAWEILRNRFPAEEYVLIEEVSDTTGGRNRSLDYMLVNLWQSRGLAITGIEKKSFRSDWLRELKDPAKQERHFKYCDYFYLLTDSENVAKLEEIPPTWGWYHINEKRILKTMKPAPKLESIPVDRKLLCCMLRRAADKKGFVRSDSIESTIEARIESAKSYWDRDRRNKVEAYDTLKKSVNEFENATGLILDDYTWRKRDWSKMGAAVKIFMDGGISQRKEQISNAFKNVERIYHNMKRDMETLDSIPDEIIDLNDGSKGY